MFWAGVLPDCDSMDWITDRIAIGNYLEAQDKALLVEHAFRSVLSLNATLNPTQAADFGLQEIAAYRLIDGHGNQLHTLRYAVDELARLADHVSPVLVHCHAGRSRSAMVVAGYLMQARGLTPSAALAAVAAKREIHVAPALLELLEQLAE